MAKQQFYNIQFPFVNDTENGAMFKLAPTDSERIKSDLRHLLFTPKGQKYMDPEFGTDLIRYVFDPSDDITWDGVRNEINQAVERYVPGVKINDIQISTDKETATDTYVQVYFTIIDGHRTIRDSLITKI